MNKLKLIRVSVISALFLLGIYSCGNKGASSTTGWEYNNAKNGGFEVAPFEEQMTGPGLVLIEGGRFTMGRTEQDVMGDWDNSPRTVTIRSFYMDEVEIRNLDYLEYLHWIYRVFAPADLITVYRKALPDSLVWRQKLAYNEPLVENYFRHPAYREYPVVGVSWEQATKYCSWRTDRVNEMILVEMGLVNLVPDPTAEGYFNTDAYLSYPEYEGNSDKRLQSIVTGENRNVKLEDGIMLPKYRLPTEAEWEYAAVGLIGNSISERILERRIYPWNGHILRTNDNKFYGDFVANTRRGRGDYMGVAGHLNDGGEITSPVYSYWPNDFGLYNMGGNVAEWVMDVYRANSNEDVNELNPYRGNEFMTKKVENDEIAERDSIGNIPMVAASEKNDYKINRRRNYRKSDNINFIDGDWTSSNVGPTKWQTNDPNGTATMYSTDIMNKAESSDLKNNSLVTDKSRVYKGASWKDIQYWASPGNRRFLEQDEASDCIGFRCAMVRLGSPVIGK